MDLVATVLTDFCLRAQPLDNKSLNRLEAAVSKSAYVGQGKKLKVTNEVSFPTGLSCFSDGRDANKHNRSTPRFSEDWLLRLATGRSTSPSLPRLPR